jgi:hypothetical protein
MVKKMDLGRFMSAISASAKECSAALDIAWFMLSKRENTGGDQLDYYDLTSDERAI